jgi:2-hydroxymuconate-semialdehyde hydrolase
MNASTRDIAVTVDGVSYTLHTHEIGAGADPAIVWLHGSGPGVSAWSNWERLITGLLPGYHHVAPDMVGFGDSTHPENPPRGIRAYAELRAQTLFALLDALGLERVHVVGNSMGGMIALRMLQLRPERFDRVALMGSGGAPSTPTPALIQMVRFYDNPTPAGMKDLLQVFLCDTTVFAGRIDEIAENRVAVAIRPEVERSHKATFDLGGAPLSFSETELAQITHETLVLHGREDQVIPVTASYYIAASLPNAQLHVLPHAGHWVQIEQAERFAAQAEIFFGEKP